MSQVYRHGDRSPVRAYPTDPYQESAWPQGFGQLTVEGMRQHFELGQMLKKRYHGFLNDSYDRHEIFVRSTDSDRTLMSAEVNLAGMYQPTGAQVFNPNLTWQPIPVHTVPEEEDKLLRFPISGCPRYDVLQKKTVQSEVYVNKTNENWEFMQMVGNKTGLHTVSLQTIWSIHDTLHCEKLHNFSLPNWVTPAVMDRLQSLKDFSFEFLFGIYRKQEKSRLQGGVLLGQILRNISLAMNTTSPQHQKLMVYSAHDTTLVALQMALGVYSGKQPSYASCHMFELYEEDNGSFSLEMYFRNESGKEPFSLTLPNCLHRCPLQDFIRLTASAIPQDWEKECQVSENSSDTDVIIGLAVCGCLLFLLIILLFVLLCRTKSKSSGYQHVGNEIDECA
ncbi:lysosomal acid phosphatase isoform X2 [Protopterus annectens]|uniref:lysosomal acid phosphatase isoform X2 n=1 Tax=Protopterus annectens TaxID=7888 RepID=UPI001CFB7F80|nr:lysosomal acid phosphatase isoform X2 [Protopterus annectens]